MNKTNIYQYYAFGHNYRTIKSDGLKGCPNSFAKDLLENFIKNLEGLELPVTSKISEKLVEIIEKIPENDEKLAADISHLIIGEIDRIDPALDAELFTT